MLTAECLLNKGLFMIGDVKTATKRFPIKDLQAATGNGNGDWATYVSKLQLGGDKTMVLYAVSHRRGGISATADDHPDDVEPGKVHNFLATCSTTLRGNAHVATLETDEERGANVQPVEVTRKAPRTVNDFSLGQPAIDRHNRCHSLALAHG